MNRLWAAFACLSTLLTLPVIHAAEPLLAFGLTNTVLGQADVSVSDPYVYVSHLSSNGTDGVSVHLGQSDSGIFLTPSTSYLSDGFFMTARAYGQLNGADSQLLSRIKGGRASDTLYPLEVDLSPLAPESVTYEVSSPGYPPRIFPAANSIVQVAWGYYPNPVVNPLTRLPDGSIGVLIEFSSTVTLVIPSLLASHTGQRIFIRAHNPSNHLGSISRVDVTGGGGLSDFTFYDAQLGMFRRPHRAFGGASFNAIEGRLEIGNLTGPTNYNSITLLPGFDIEVGSVARTTLDFTPFTLANTNTLLAVTAVGFSGGSGYTTLGTLSLRRTETQLELGLEQGLSSDTVVEIHSAETLVHRATLTPADIVTLPTNASVGRVTAQVKTAETSPGFAVRFAQNVSMAFGTNATEVQGDELRFLIPDVRSFENLNNLSAFAYQLGSVTITNETVTPVAGPPTLGIAKTPGNEVSLSWIDPNHLYVAEGTVFPWNYFSTLTNEVSYTEPVASVQVPIVTSNDLQWFRLRYSPSSNP